MRRGFKTEANEVAREVRAELRLRTEDPLDPWKLAAHLEIPIIGLSEYRVELPECVRQFSSKDQGAFSAVTVFRGPARMIVHNDYHFLGRQASNLAHELSHALLLHPPTPALDHRGCRNWDDEVEDEADWLAGALLVSEEAALAVVRRKLSVEAAAALYGVSPKMMQFRINVTGARVRIARGQRRWGR